MATIISFAVGVLSSIAAAWIFLLREKARLRLRFRAVLSLITGLAGQIERDGFKPDYIVTIDRNSGVVGSILAGYIGLRAVVSIAAVHRRLPGGSRETRLDPLSTQMLPLLAGSKVLVLICCNDSGTSLNHVVRALQELGKDAPADIRTAALYTTISPAILPDYKAVVVGRDTRRSMNQIISRLPWMGHGWRHMLAAERIQQT
jgi:hypoxanthine phosphoribosyltransferase